MLKLFLKYKKSITFLFLLIIGLAVYANSFNNEFFWDDDDSIVNNVYIKDWQYLPQYFTENLIAGAGQVSNYYRPVLLMSFAFDYQLSELTPGWFHFVNTLLHIFSAWLIFLLLTKLVNKNSKNSDKIILPFLVSLFFLIHPLQTEAVTYVAGRADPLSTVFSLSAILFYLNYREKKKIKDYLFCLLFFVLGILTKEQVVLLPILILLIEVIFISTKISKKNLIKIAKLILPLFLISLVYVLLRVSLLNFNDLLGGTDYNEVYDSNVFYRLLTFAYVLLNYFKLLFIPVDLHMARQVPLITSVLDCRVLLFLVIFVSIIVVCFKTWKKDRLITFGFLWFFVLLAIRSNILQINRPMYEHWLYLPMMGFWLAIFSLISLVFYKGPVAKSGIRRQAHKIKKEKLRLYLVYVGFIIIITYIVFLSVLTIRRNNDWQNAIIFYEKNLQYTPDSFIQHNNLGMAYADAGREEEAVSEYRTALVIKDVYPQVHHNLANSLLALGKMEEAEIEYEKAIEMSPGFNLPYNNLLSIYLNNKDKTKALAIVERIKEQFGEDVNYFYLLGIVYYSFEDYEKAIEEWRRGLDIEPGNKEIRELVNFSKQVYKVKSP